MPDKNSINTPARTFLASGMPAEFYEKLRLDGEKRKSELFTVEHILNVAIKNNCDYESISKDDLIHEYAKIIYSLLGNKFNELIEKLIEISTWNDE